MDKLHVRLTPDEADLIAATMQAAMGESVAAGTDEETAVLIQRFRHLAARARQRAARTPAARPGGTPQPEEG